MTTSALFIVIAIIAVIVVVLLATQRSGPRVTEITRRRGRRDGEESK